MRKGFLAVFLIIFAISCLIYLNRSYARIYDYTNKATPSVSESSSFLANQDSKKTIKYVALGDSLSKGVGSDDYRKTVTYIFADKLSEKYSVDYINLAVSGATTYDLINYQLDEAINVKPNYITLFIGTNDIHDLVSEKDFQQNMNTIISKLQKNTDAKIVVFNIPYLGSNNLILPPYNFILDIQINKFNSIIKNICLDKNLMLIDLYTPTKDIFSQRENFYSSDQFHPSETGYLLWGSLIDNKVF